MRDERRFVNIKPEKKNLPACGGSASGASTPVTVASHMTWCCSDHSGGQIQCMMVVEFQDRFVNIKPEPLGVYVNIKKKICLHTEDQRVAQARQSRSPLT